jgi:hypothetical protein
MIILLLGSVAYLTWVSFILCKTVLFLLFPHKRVFWPSWKVNLERMRDNQRERYMSEIESLLDAHPEMISDNETFNKILRIKQ